MPGTAQMSIARDTLKINEKQEKKAIPGTSSQPMDRWLSDRLLADGTGIRRKYLNYRVLNRGFTEWITGARLSPTEYIRGHGR